MLAPTASAEPFHWKTVIADRAPHRVGDAARLLQRAVGQQHAELVTAEPCDRVGGPHPRLDQARDLADQPIAGRMPAGVVDQLELVEVDVEHRVAAAVVAHRLHRCLQPVVELAPVDQAGQRIVRRLVGQRAPQPALARDVVEHDDGARDLPAAITDRRRRILDRKLMPRAVDQRALVGGSNLRAARQGAQQGVAERRARGIVDEPQHRLDRLALHFEQAPAGQLLGDRVHVVDAARRIVVITASPIDCSVTSARSFSWNTACSARLRSVMSAIVPS
jgi:hypothetical protein